MSTSCPESLRRLTLLVAFLCCMLVIAGDRSVAARSADEPLHAVSPGDSVQAGTYGALALKWAGRWNLFLPQSAAARLRRPAEGAEVSAGEAALIARIFRKAEEDVDAEAVRTEALRMVRSLGRWQTITPRFGIRPRPEGEDDSLRAAIERGEGRAVLLVHGLDDPGWMWDDLAPALTDAGHVALEFTYPNDGPIVEAADLLALALAHLVAEGATSIDIVAHSMGGLVVRDLLTRPLLAGARGAELPMVDRFIMCGTPNHGAPLAAFRGLTDLRERAVRTARGEDPSVASLPEGSGQAGEDLLPASDFLRELGRRSAPECVRMTIIAGRLTADPADAVEGAAERTGQALDEAKAPAWAVDWVRRFGRSLARTASRTLDAVGDGLVPLDSARLEGVDDFVIVEANHASMLISRFGGPPVPPAIPIVLDRLSDRLLPADDGSDPG